MRTQRRKRMTEPILLWSSEWPISQLPSDPRIEIKRQKYIFHTEIKEDIAAAVSCTVFDPKEPLLNTKHQEITKIPHEIRGETIRSLKGRGFIRRTFDSILRPVDTESQCCQIMSCYLNGLQLPVFID